MQFPHCDSLILHAPLVCKYCDRYPEWQAARTRGKINFTGEYDENKAPCPSEVNRPLEKIYHWSGNIPYKGTVE